MFELLKRGKVERAAMSIISKISFFINRIFVVILNSPLKIMKLNCNHKQSQQELFTLEQSAKNVIPFVITIYDIFIIVVIIFGGLFSAFSLPTHKPPIERKD
jgi:hypothetical protein